MIYTQRFTASHMLAEINRKLCEYKLELAFLQSGEQSMSLTPAEFKAFSDLFIIRVNEAFPDECFSFEFGERDATVLFVNFRYRSFTYTFEINQSFSIKAYSYLTARGHSSSKTPLDIPVFRESVDPKNIDQAAMLFIAFYRQIPTDHTGFAAYCDHMDLKHLYHSVAKAIIDLKLDKTFTYYCETTLTTVFFTIEYLSKDEKKSYYLKVNKLPAGKIYISMFDEKDGYIELLESPLEDMSSEYVMECFHIYLTAIGSD